MAADRYDERVVREAWQRLLWQSSVLPRRRPTAEAERLAACSVHVADAVGEKVLLGAIASAWSQGWQPAELVHHVGHKGGRAAGRLTDLAIVADHDRRPGQVLDPRWQTQVEALGSRSESTRLDWLRQWRRRDGMDRRQCYDAVGDSWRVFSRLPRLPVLVPPPGQDSSVLDFPGPVTGATADPALERIRKLLAKAESTPFEAEAEALTAKAQQLMARHAVDRAQLRGTVPEGPRMVRLMLESPHASAKCVLLGAVAAANRCQAIELRGLGLGVLVGHADDLASVEALFTSLLVQAGNALRVAGQGDGGARARSASFRRSFYLGFAGRIRERLAAVDAAVLADPSASGSLPVLRSRAQAVEDAVARFFGGRLDRSAVGGRGDALGAAQGRHAAGQARLHAGSLSVADHPVTDRQSWPAESSSASMIR
ncbi:DUF2786 domain-containing protein [Nocardioides caeni]|uniref:DUF2786 domain-containing protein n=1 Tax=Nocardioides caeni TaxID=574700 RepID=A0A4S8NE60_9ACTN|nr:DUF2786 domain-containing protein [Nocardioides caeni]THV14585.1 DUF2786 domain-containing protein [Nocardioides caeni]